MMADEELTPLSVRIATDTYRRAKIESVNSGQTLRELVQVALEDLLERRAEDRRDLERGQFGRCGD